MLVRFSGASIGALGGAEDEDDPKKLRIALKPEKPNPGPLLEPALEDPGLEGRLLLRRELFIRLGLDGAELELELGKLKLLEPALEKPGLGGGLELRRGLEEGLEGGL